MFQGWTKTATRQNGQNAAGHLWVEAGLILSSRHSEAEGAQFNRRFSFDFPVYEGRQAGGQILFLFVLQQQTKDEER